MRLLADRASGTIRRAETGSTCQSRSVRLPKDFFEPDADTKCGGQVIGYRFVVWLNRDELVLGFNTSPNCRQFPNRKVAGSARLLAFDASGEFKAERDIPYLADGTVNW